MHDDIRLIAVNYHYFREHMPKGGIYPINRQQFLDQIEEISKHYKIISQKQLLDIVSGKIKEGRFCILTFDDGFKEQMGMFEILVQKGLGGIFHVVSDTIEHGAVLDIHKIHHVRSVIEDEQMYSMLERDYSISKFNFDDKLLSEKYKYDDERARKIKYFLSFVMDPYEQKRFIDGIFKDLVPDEREFASRLYMDKEDIKKIARHGMLGTHSSSHHPLASLPRKDMLEDIRHSIRFLNSVTGVKVHSISYPYGVGSAVSDELMAVAKEAGLDLGFTVSRGVNDSVDLKSSLCLKRINTNEAPGGSLNSREYC